MFVELTFVDQYIADWYNMNRPVCWGCVSEEVLPLMKAAQLNLGSGKCPFCQGSLRDAGTKLADISLYMCDRGHLIDKT